MPFRLHTEGAVLWASRFAAPLADGSIDPKAHCLSDFVAVAYEACHPGDTWEALERRSHFDRHSRGLMNEWLKIAIRRRDDFMREIARRMKTRIDHMLIETIFGRAA